MSKKQDPRDKVVEQIISLMDEVGTDWVKCWSSMGNQRNAATGRPYQGGNALLLSLLMTVNKYAYPLWLTWGQMKKLGGHVKQDQWNESCFVLWVRPDTYIVTDENGEPVLDENGEPEERVRFRRGMSQVWNVAQTTVDEKKYAKYLPELQEVKTEAEIDKWISLVLKGEGCAPFESVLGSDRAFYHPGEDSIRLPGLKQFKDSEGYYSTLFHEMAHSTGHKTRLSRGVGSARFGSPAYAQEELVAEFTAALLCAEFGIEGRANHAKYLKGWLGACKSDSSILFTAAAQAKKALNYMEEAVKRVEKVKRIPLGEDRGKIAA